jgi:hypothetical protein
MTLLPDEPHDVGEIRNSGAIQYVLAHIFIFHSINVQGKGPYRNPNHAFFVIEEFDCFCVQREIISSIIKSNSSNI